MDGIKHLRAGRYGGVDVVTYVTMKSGTLRGQTLTKFISNYPTEAEARAAHPDVAGWVNSYTAPQVSLNHLPGEDDPAPGGMWPDDIQSLGGVE